MTAKEKTMEQKPSVCRNVHYQSYGSPGGEYKSLPRAAIITEVNEADESLVGLCILNPTGMFFTKDVRYDPSGAPGTWRWPPRV